MKVILTLILGLSSLLLLACSPSLQKNEIDPWLQDIAQDSPVKANFQGEWEDIAKNGWGKVSIKQEGNKLSGMIDTYKIIGKVSGKTAYIVLIYSGEVHYTLKLNMKDNDNIEGQYFYANDKQQQTGKDTYFTRTK